MLNKKILLSSIIMLCGCNEQGAWVEKPVEAETIIEEALPEWITYKFDDDLMTKGTWAGLLGNEESILKLILKPKIWYYVVVKGFTIESRGIFQKAKYLNVIARYNDVSIDFSDEQDCSINNDGSICYYFQYQEKDNMQGIGYELFVSDLDENKDIDDISGVLVKIIEENRGNEIEGFISYI